jgi:hypothetical protein
MKSRIVSQEVRLTTADDRDYQLKIRVMPVIPPLNGRHFAAKPDTLVSLHRKSAIPVRGLLDTFGVSEQDAARACIEKVEQFLTMRDKRA